MRALSLALLLAACGGDKEETAAERGAEPITGVSLTTSFGAFVVTFIEVDPDPPDVGNNTWTLEVTDAEGTVDDAEVVVTPVMPEHGHGTAPPDFTGSPRGDGLYEVGPMDLIMSGAWLVDVYVSTAAGGDHGSIEIWVEG